MKSGKSKQAKAPWVGMSSGIKPHGHGREKSKPKSKAKKPSVLEYAKKAIKWKAGKRCSICGYAKGIDVHHTRGRLGKLLLDERYWVALCRLHHAQVHAYPGWARSKGLICEKGDWNKA